MKIIENLKFRIMETKQLSNGRVEISTDADHIIRKKGDTAPTEIRRLTVKAEKLGQWEEVAIADMRPYSDEQYNDKVAELVAERYPMAEENAITRKLLNKLLHPEAATLDGQGTDTELPKEVAQFEAYNAYVEDCKLRAKDPELYVEPTPDEVDESDSDESAAENPAEAADSNDTEQP